MRKYNGLHKGDIVTYTKENKEYIVTELLESEGFCVLQSIKDNKVKFIASVYLCKKREN